MAFTSMYRDQVCCQLEEISAEFSSELFLLPSCRSRYERFHAKRYARVRSREPSRIPIKELMRVFRKSRKMRRRARRNISRSFPQSSKIHCYTNYFDCCCGKNSPFRTCLNWKNKHVRLNEGKHFNHCKQNLRESTKVHVLRTRKHKANKRLAVFKTLNQRTNYCKTLLSTDIEKNPGPAIIDPSKTIAAPYSQGNVEVFGSTNEGTQCVAMSLSALVFIIIIIIFIFFIFGVTFVHANLCRHIFASTCQDGGNPFPVIRLLVVNSVTDSPRHTLRLPALHSQWSRQVHLIHQSITGFLVVQEPTCTHAHEYRLLGASCYQKIYYQ